MSKQTGSKRCYCGFKIRGPNHEAGEHHQGKTLRLNNASVKASEKK